MGTGSYKQQGIRQQKDQSGASQSASSNFSNNPNAQQQSAKNAPKPDDGHPIGK